MAKLLDDSRQAFRQFAVHPEVSFNYISNLLDHSFQGQLIELIELMEPIYKAQVILEDGKLTLSYVYSQWIEITTHLQKTANSCNTFAQLVKSFLENNNGKTWKARVDRQITDIHIAAYFLQPSNYNKPINQGQLNQIWKLFKHHFTDYNKQFRIFLDFQHQRGLFHPGSKSWDMVHDPILFWMYNEAKCYELSSFTLRLLNTIGNSVPSERVWSNMNYIHSKSRNRLLLETVNKLLYIYNNLQILRHLKIDSLPEMEQLAWGEQEQVESRLIWL